MKRNISAIILLALTAIAFAQPQSGYYTSSTLDGKNGRDLELALKACISHTTILNWTGETIWDAMITTDSAPQDTLSEYGYDSSAKVVFDMYAWIKFLPKLHTDKNRTQTGGINREHVVPNSWWGADDISKGAKNKMAYSDLHNLVPADGAVNVRKANWPLGEPTEGTPCSLYFPVQNLPTTATSESQYYVRADHPSGKIWTSTNSQNFGRAGSVFEPADEYKGDFARMYLYMVCAYEGDFTWRITANDTTIGKNYMFENDGSSNNYTNIKQWALALLLKWHRQDPVSQKERDRNNAVEGIQHNRNPFIDYPELVEYIWGNKTSQQFSLASAVSAYSDAYINGNTGGGETPGGETPTEKQAATLMFTLHARVGQPFNGFIYSSDSNGAATYSSSNTNVATVDAATGAVTIVGAGTTTITYAVAETDSFNAAQEQYQIEVTE